jgi:hypothetical protein
MERRFQYDPAITEQLVEVLLSLLESSPESDLDYAEASANRLQEARCNSSEDEQ